MPFLEVNGLELEVVKFDEASDDPEYFGRGSGLTYEGTTYAEKRSWDLDLNIMTQAKADSVQGWVKGRGHYWTFERVDGATTRLNAFSVDGGLGFSVSASSISATTAKFGTWGALVHSTIDLLATASFGNERNYSMSVWRKHNATMPFELCSFTYNGTTTRYYAGTTITSAFAWTVISAASGSLAVTLEAENNAGSNSTVSFDGLMIVPYEMTTDMLSARNARTAAEPPFPYVGVSGDAFPDNAEIVAKGFIASHEAEKSVVLEGATQTNAQWLTGKLIER